MTRAVEASAPGSLMLFGEHAVLRGHPALVCAVSARLAVRAQPRTDGRLRVESALGTLEGRADAPPGDPRFRFLVAAIRRRAADFAGGLDLRVRSEFPPDIGFGSSAAVTVATLAALDALAGRAPERHALFVEAREVVRAVQGLGSGADVAASVHGGTLAYRADPPEVRPLPGAPPLTVVYSGRKTPTPEVVRRVEAARAQEPGIFDGLLSLAGRLAARAADAWAASDWPRVGALMNAAQGVMDALGVNDARLAEIVFALREQPGVMGAKISGSGLGDCAIALGRAAAWDKPYRRIEVEIAAEGLRVEADP